VATGQPRPANRLRRTPGTLAVPAIPPALDRYRLLRPIGRGGTAIVYEAIDPPLGRRVAIKLIPREPADNERRTRLPREASLAGQVRHPHVVRLFGTGRYPGGDFLVMELVAGPSVQALLNDGPFPWREATATMVAACKGARAVHARGIIHGDIKPANLLRTVDYTVKLTDFGLSHWLDPSLRCAGGKGAGGTPHYMSPERCRDEECDERADIYSLGATYHALLTGQTPYADAPHREIMFAHCAAPVPDPRTLSRQVPRACALVVMRAMAKKRAERYACAGEMRCALRKALRGRSKAWRI